MKEQVLTIVTQLPCESVTQAQKSAQEMSRSHHGEFDRNLTIQSFCITPDIHKIF
jgi:hypothetical protein